MVCTLLKIVMMACTYSNNFICGHASQSKPVKIGPWGGDGGEPRDIEYTPLALVRVAIRSGDAINAIGFTYVDTSGNLHEEEWGGSEGEKFEELLLQELEYVLEISGTYGSPPESYATSLELVTNKGRTIRGGSAGSGGSFNVPLVSARIIGFFGAAGTTYIDSFGMYAGFAA
ncbi:horcolin isoform X1 [Triticum aestivum]|uniref:horcolin isoform X1 n=1 Tax=Triticum aestivum TaxID=4565 RepID=UPI001D0356D9|nr:horcolin-like isoform X1 [Triticum aestivum]